jgi:hypothetical protein
MLGHSTLDSMLVHEFNDIWYPLHRSLPEHPSSPVSDCSHIGLYNPFSIWDRARSPVTIPPPPYLQLHLLPCRQHISPLSQPSSPGNLSNNCNVHVLGLAPRLIATKLRSFKVILERLYEPWVAKSANAQYRLFRRNWDNVSPQHLQSFIHISLFLWIFADVLLFLAILVRRVERVCKKRSAISE